ncbi:MAG: glucose 1-dehydrogenase [Gemmatimonadaceae bacterium]|nr:glucose 1-dehydrogenase [Gemmatimonadaceae bacterium]
MFALTVIPHKNGSASVDEVSEPALAEGNVLIAAEGCGVCGTDFEILNGDHGALPPGEPRLILGHESIGRVLEAPAGSGLAEGDWVCGIVRRPDPLPCPSCAGGEWDMCQNGEYTEHGIKGVHGFARERYRIDHQFVVRVDPALAECGVLLEPASIVAKAWQQIERIGRRALWQPERVLVTGAGPIGLLAALMGVQRRMSVHVFDQVTSGPKPQLVADLGATYHSGTIESVGSADIVIECTGAPTVAMAAMKAARRNGIVCLTGVSTIGQRLAVDVGGLNRKLVLENNVVFGSVNANRTHYEQGAEALLRADRGWLNRLVTRRVPLRLWREAMEHREDDVKTVITFG